MGELGFLRKRIARATLVMIFFFSRGLLIILFEGAKSLDVDSKFNWSISFDVRVNWVEEHVPDIYGRAKKALDLSFFFLSSDFDSTKILTEHLTSHRTAIIHRWLRISCGTYSCHFPLLFRIRTRICALGRLTPHIQAARRIQNRISWPFQSTSKSE